MAAPATNNGSDVAPAIITNVFTNDCVNVRVFLDSTAVPAWRTSVPLYEDREALEAGRVKWAELVGADPSHYVAAYWPPRV